MNEQEKNQWTHELQENGIAVTVTRHHRDGAFGAGETILIAFVIANLASSVLNEAGKDTWRLVKQFARGVFSRVPGHKAGCTALLTAHDERGTQLRIKSPIETEADVIAFAETAKNCIWSFAAGEYESSKKVHRKIRISITMKGDKEHTRSAREEDRTIESMATV